MVRLDGGRGVAERKPFLPDRRSRFERAARAQHGLALWDEARALLGANEAEHWRRTGRLVPVHRHLYRLATSEPSWHQELAAAALATDGVVSHRAAAELWGMLDPAGWVEVTAPDGGRLRAPAIVHRGERRAEARAGLRVTDPLETLCDLNLVAPAWVVNAAVDRALGTRLVSIHALTHLLGGEVTRREDDVAALRAAVRTRRLPSSDDEAAHASRVAAVLSQTEVGLPRLWHEVWHDGRFVARADAAAPGRRLAVVVEHRGGAEDRWAAVPDVRVERLEEAGWRVVHTTSAELRRHPGRLVARVARALADRSRPGGRRP